MDLPNEHAGQLFTPYPICQMMARMQIDGLREIVQEKGFITMQAPSIGVGAMVIALADELKNEGINYQQAMHVTLVDIDIRAVYIAYTQFSLFHIPAVVIHGNTLSLEEWSRWYTPAYILGFWDSKLKKESVRGSVEQEIPKETKPSKGLHLELLWLNFLN